MPAYCTCLKVLQKWQKANEYIFVCMRKGKSAKSSLNIQHQRRLRQHYFVVISQKLKIRCASNGWLLNRNATHESNKHTQVSLAQFLSFSLLFGCLVIGSDICALSVGNKYNDIKTWKYLSLSSFGVCFASRYDMRAKCVHTQATFELNCTLFTVHVHGYVIRR